MRQTRFRWSGIAAILAATLLTTSAIAQSGLVVQQHTTFNVAKITSGDLTQTMSILGADRGKTVTTGKMKILIISKDASGSEITRLDRDSVYKLDDKKKEYTARSLADVRAELAKQQADAEKQMNDGKRNDEVRYVVEVAEVKQTGERQTINGFSTERVLARLKVFSENTKTNARTLAYHITTDAWIDKSQGEAGRAALGYQTAQIKALGVAPAMATNPYAKWLTNVHGEIAKIEGYPIRTTITFELPADSTATATRQADTPPPTSVSGAVLGAMFGGNKKKEPEPASPNGGIVVFTSTNEILSISFRAPAASEFEVPAGYKKK